MRIVGEREDLAKVWRHTQAPYGPQFRVGNGRVLWDGLVLTVRYALEPLATTVKKLSPLFAGGEGDPVPAAPQTLFERGQGPLPYLTILV